MPETTPSLPDTDPFVQEVARHYTELFPDGDITDVELNLAVVRGFVGIEAVMANYLAPKGLTRTRYTVLRVLYFAEGQRLAMSEISRRVNVNNANITRQIDALESQGLVRRTASPGDRRVVYAELTPEGRTFAGEIIPQVYDLTTEIWSVLEPEEKATLKRALARFRLSVDRRLGIPNAVPTVGD